MIMSLYSKEMNEIMGTLNLLRSVNKINEDNIKSLELEKLELKDCIRDLIACINEGSYNLSMAIKKCQSKL